MERLVGRIHGVQDYPPKLVRPQWSAIEAYRHRFENDRARLIQNNPRWHGEAGKLFEPVPVAYEMARLSSSLLFSERVGATMPTEEGTEKSPLQPALDEILEDSRFDEFCHESGEYVANQGVIGVRIVRDEEVSDLPLLTWVHGDQILWDVRYGRYVKGGAVVTERMPEEGPGKPVYRMVEEHGKGYVERALYKGTGTTLGRPVALDSLDEFVGLPEFEETGLDESTLVMWKNIPGGRSDLFPILGQLDRIDEAEALLVEKARKSRPWLFAGRGLANDQGVVDISNLIFMERGETNEALGITEGGRLVEHVQPSMQSEEHIAWSFHVLDLCLMMSGYSLATWGRDASGGGADSGLALKLKQSRTLLNRAGKDRMGRQSLARALAVALALRENPNAANAIVRVRDYLPDIELGDGFPEDPLQTAQEIQTLDSAKAITPEEKVRMRHPDYDDARVAEEAAKLGAAEGPAERLSRALNDGFPLD